MLGGVNNNFIRACEEIKRIVTSDLKEKIENKNLSNKDITAIMRSVLVIKNEDGSLHIEKRDINEKAIAMPNEDIIKLREEMALIRNICISSIQQPTAEVQVARGKKHKLEEPDEESDSKKQKSVKESVSIARTNKKRKVEEQEEEQPTKKQMLQKSKLKISEVGEMFSIESEIPDAVLGMITECIDQTPSVIIDIVKNKEKIPEYLKQNLFHLDLSHSQVDFDTFKAIIHEFKNLKSIILPIHADNSWVELLSRELPNLNALNLSNCSRIHSDGISYIASMKSLKSLNLSGNEKIGKPDLDIIFRELSLQELNLYHCTGIIGNAFENIGECSESLQDLNIGVTYLSDKALIHIVDNVKGLRRLSLSYSKSITNTGLDAAIQGFKELEYLDLSGTLIDDKGLANINQRYNTLQSLILADCPNISGEFLTHIEHNFTVLKEFSLTGVYSRFSSKFDGTHNFISSNLYYMTNRFPALENLDLSSIQLDEDAELVGHIVRGAINLESLHLKSTNIGNEGLVSIASECPNLKKLDLEFCGQKINVGLYAILEGCKKLQYLSLDFSKVDDSTFETIADSKRKLIRLSLDTCRELTVKSFVNISRGCPSLKFINVGRCVMTDVALSNLYDNTRDLEIDFNGRVVPRSVDMN